MSNERSARERDLRRLCRRLAVAALVFAIATPPLVLSSWIFGDAATMAGELIGRPLVNELAGWRIIAAAVISTAPACFVAAALLSARRCFLGFAKGDFLTNDAASALRGFGRNVALAGALGLITPTVLGLILSWEEPVGQRALLVALSSGPAFGILFGAMVYALGHVMSRAARLAEDHAQIV